MNNNNNNKKSKGNKSNLAQAKKALKNEILNEIRAAAGQPAKGRGRGKRNRQAKAQQGKHAQTSAASAYATGQSGQGAKIQATREMCRVSHREFIGNVTGSVLFTIASIFAINPGVAASFPWLSGIAQNWETYRFRKLRLCYYTRTGTGVPGSVIMAHDPDASDAAPASEQVMTTYENCEEDAPWKDICMEFSLLGLNDLGPRKFVRSAGLAANQDIKLYDSGNAYVATVDGTAVPWGKLWFEYDVDFFTPQLPPAGLPITGGTIAPGGVITPANPLGSVPVQDTQSQGFTVDAASVVTVTNVGTYLVTHSIEGTVLTAQTVTAVGSAVATPRDGFVVNAAGTIAEKNYEVQITAPGGTFSVAVTATTVTGGRLRIASVPAGSLN